MDENNSFYEAQKYDFSDTSFSHLLQNRIHRVLLICSNYAAFMLEEDGRIDEQIFNEYVSLNLRYPPIFIQVDSEERAFETLKIDHIDLIILAPGNRELGVFQVANNLKNQYHNIPIIVLTQFTREVRLKIENEDLSSIDYVFSWLGNSDLLLAIIKLIEDKMNADHDVKKIGVQTILLVEDSIRYISSYLPNLYKIILKQSKEFQREALNEHQMMLRMRGRPKILLATNYEEAETLFMKYRDNMLGVISDVSFKRNGKVEKQAGIMFCKMVRDTDKHMPVLIQSSDLENEKHAEELDAGFINKFSKSLSFELRNFLIKNLAFGPFLFRDPDTMKEIARAVNLQEFQHIMMTIPDETLAYHTSRNHFSRWLNARALFPLAQMFKYIRNDDFNSLNDVRHFLYSAISSFRYGKGRGVIAKFDKDNFDEYLIFSRIGNGSIGGKARGLAFMNSVIKKSKLFNKYPGVYITIPRTVVICTDTFDEFMESNDLYRIGLSDLTDEEIHQHFLKAELPGTLYQDLYKIISVMTRPLAVRSSSKLEDSHYQPFAGVYSTYMLPNVADKKKMVKFLSEAIKEVYASVYYKTSKSYMSATSNVIDEEKMGIIIQEVCGSDHKGFYYPTFSGVARSINFYPIGSEKAEDGIVRVGLGLGKLIVEGGLSLRFSPRYPKKILQLSSPDMALKSTQKVFYALDLASESFIPSVDDGINLRKFPIDDAKDNPSLKYLTSTYDFENEMIRDGTLTKGKKIITFSQILNHKSFPLAQIIMELLEIGQREMTNPVEIEFAVNMEPGEKNSIYFTALQIRPIVDSPQGEVADLEEVNEKDAIVVSDSAMGNGYITEVRDIVYVKPDSFNASKTKIIAANLEKLNEKFIQDNKNYVLIGPGRWGSQDPWLGVPVKWPHISQAKVIIESGLENFRIDPSQGTHFFQNLTSFRVGYFTINPFINDGYYDLEFLDKTKAVYEDEHLRHVSYPTDFCIRIDGRNNKGVILKPNPREEKTKD
ncbi:MAG: PEP/pyruvate-binding domain-containing protein [Bacteroidota bacterium]|nr:PEP/pyruvate-binding domain-containing protein [Bacteroidota bacterium]